MVFEDIFSFFVLYVVVEVVSFAILWRTFSKEKVQRSTSVAEYKGCLTGNLQTLLR